LKSGKQIVFTVSEKFHADVKAFAAQKRISIKDLIIELLAKHIMQHKQGDHE
jgi:predicted HicB family RNase H-like nuclease